MCAYGLMLKDVMVFVSFLMRHNVPSVIRHCVMIQRGFTRFVTFAACFRVIYVLLSFSRACRQLVLRCFGKYSVARCNRYGFDVESGT